MNFVRKQWDLSMAEIMVNIFSTTLPLDWVNDQDIELHTLDFDLLKKKTFNLLKLDLLTPAP